MTTPTRVYHVTDDEGTVRLVRASHKSAVFMHVAKTAFTVRPATVDDMESLLPGVKVEAAKAAPIEQGELEV